MGDKLAESSELLDSVLFTYSIDHMEQKDKVRFYYALKGRDGKTGMLAMKGVIQLGRTVIIVPRDMSEEFNDFLTEWKCEYQTKNLLLPIKDGAIQ
jgi:hypothetical protein